MDGNAGFSEYAKSGFQITFENGWSVSVQFSPIHSCSNKATALPHLLKAFQAEEIAFASELACPNAEVAAFKGDEWYKFENGGEVNGWVKPAELLAFMNEIAAK